MYAERVIRDDNFLTIPAHIPNKFSTLVNVEIIIIGKLKLEYMQRYIFMCLIFLVDFQIPIFR